MIGPGMDGSLDIIRRCFPAGLLRDIAELCRGRFEGTLVLRMHEGKVLKAEQRTVRVYDARAC